MKVQKDNFYYKKRSNWLGRFWRGYIRPAWENYRWLVIGMLWLGTFVLGCIGAVKQMMVLESIGDERSLLDPFYRAMQLFFMDDSMVSVGPVLPWELELVRFSAPYVAMYTAVMALAALFHEKLQRFRLRFMKNHVVICGLGRKGLLLAKGFHEYGERVVMIEQDANNPLLEQCKDQGVTVLVGNVTDMERLRRARVHKARYLFCVCGDDGVNAEVAVNAYELVGDRRGRVLTCFVHIYDPQLCNLIREREILTEKVDSFRLEFFNIFDNGARTLLNRYPAFSETEEAENSRSHMLLIGLGKMGKSLVVHAARSWWTNHSKTRERLRVTIIDSEAEQKTETLRLRYPQLGKVCELFPLQMGIHSLEFQQGKFLYDPQGHCDITTVYVCLDNDSLAFTAGLTLFQRIREGRIPIVVRMTHNAGLATILRGLETGRGGGFDNLHAFGLLDQTCTPELIIGGTHEVIAQAIHEDYVRHQEKLGKTPRDNPSMVPWDKLPNNLKESNRLQADHIGVKLKAVRCGIAPMADWDAELLEFTPEEVELMAEMEHERFVEEREREGWKLAPGPKDIERKTSPYLIPWDDKNLPDDIKELDRNTVRGLPAFLAKVGLQVYRVK